MPASVDATVAPADDQPYILYQLRPGEDPSKVAKTFQIPLEELLAVNHIGDPHRLAAGAVLSVPDARAKRLIELRDTNARLERDGAQARSRIDRLERQLRDLQGEIADLRGMNTALAGRQTWYERMRVALLIATGIALALAIALLVTVARAHEEERRRLQAVRRSDALQSGIEKYRQMGAQLELKYQAVFRQAGSQPMVQQQAAALRRSYEEEVERLDVLVDDEQRRIERAGKEGGDAPTKQRLSPPTRVSRTGT